MYNKQGMKNMMRIMILVCSLSLASVHSGFTADDDEINFLFSYIRASDCIFIRNGEQHQASEASEHLEMKYNHIKGRIKSAEELIDKVATKSSFTGKRYEVICDNVKSATKDWLIDALDTHRTKKLYNE